MKIRNSYRLVGLLLACLPVFAQLPEEPKPQHEFNKYSGHYILDWKETFTGKDFVIPYGTLWLSSIFDAEASVQGLKAHRAGCYESNRRIYPANPTRGDYYREMVIENSVVTGLAILVRKLGFRWWVYDGPAVYGSVIHIRAGVNWRSCW